MKIREQKISQFLKDLSSKKPVPGGGSVSALSGAIATALVQMVANLTIGKDKYQQVEKEVRSLLKKAKGLQIELLDLADKDTLAYQKVVKAYKLPKDSDVRSGKIQEAYRQATEVPLETAEKALKVFKIAEWLVDNGNQNARSDALVAIEMAQAGIYGALENIRINLPYIKDENYVSELKERMETILDKVEKVRI